MKWSNLYLTELKSDYSIQPTLLAIELIIGLIVIIVSLLNFTYVEKALFAWQFIAITLSVCFLIYIVAKQVFLRNLTITTLYLDGGKGTAVYQGKCYQVSEKSRVGFLGGYLALTEINETSPHPSHNSLNKIIGKMFKDKLVFLDKRLMNAQQFSTLCFTIKRLHHLKHH